MGGPTRPLVAPKLVLPLGLLATVAILLLTWETRLVRREAFNAIRGGGTVLAMLLLLIYAGAESSGDQHQPRRPDG